MTLLIIEANDADKLLEYLDFKYIKNVHREVFDKKRLIRLYGNHGIFLKN